MKKSRIFMAAGTLMLAITAIFATKANKKFFTSPTAVYFKNSTNDLFITNGGSTFSLLTTANNGSGILAKAELYTGTSSLKYGATLVTSGGHPLYHN